MPEWSVRSATAADESFLWEMLYEAIYVPVGEDPPPRSIVEHPDVAKYLKGWGREGDLAVVAEDTGTGKPVGAAWLRLWPGDDHGYGFVDAETPELLVAVQRGFRGKGIGTRLMEELLGIAGERFPAVSLSVWPENSAKRLYWRLGFEIVGRCGRAWTMTKKLDDAGG